MGKHLGQGDLSGRKKKAAKDTAARKGLIKAIRGQAFEDAKKKLDESVVATEKSLRAGKVKAPCKFPLVHSCR